MHDAVALRLGLMVMAPINAKWGWQAGGMMSVAGESHADLWEAFNGGALGGVKLYRQSGLEMVVIVRGVRV